MLKHNTFKRADYVITNNKLGVYVWTHEVPDGQLSSDRVYENLYYLSIEDIKGMQPSLQGTYALSNHISGYRHFKPGLITGIPVASGIYQHFATVYASMLLMGFNYGYLTREELVDRVVAHYKDYYQQRYKNESRIKSDFCARFFTGVPQFNFGKGFDTWEDMEKAVAHYLEEEGTTRYWRSEGGELAGYFTQDDTVHPRHEKKRYIADYQNWEKVAMAFKYFYIPDTEYSIRMAEAEAYILTTAKTMGRVQIYDTLHSCDNLRDDLKYEEIQSDVEDLAKKNINTAIYKPACYITRQLMKHIDEERMQKLHTEVSRYIFDCVTEATKGTLAVPSEEDRKLSADVDLKALTLSEMLDLGAQRGVFMNKSEAASKA